MDLSEQAGSKPSPSARSRNSPGESSQSTGQMFPATETCENSPRQNLLPMELPLTSLQAASHAKTFPSQAKAPASLAQEVGFGPRSIDLLAKYDRNSSSWRTSQTCLLALADSQADGFAEFSGIWPSAGMMLNGVSYRLGSWDSLMGEIVSGLWPTPSKNDGRGFYRISSASTRRRASGKTKRQLHWLHRAILESGREGIFVANPRFSMEIMGFPPSWVDLEPEETPSSRKSRNSSATQSSRRSKPKA